MTEKEFVKFYDDVINFPENIVIDYNGEQLYLKNKRVEGEVVFCLSAHYHNLKSKVFVNPKRIWNGGNCQSCFLIE